MLGRVQASLAQLAADAAWTRPPRARVLAIVGATGTTESCTHMAIARMVRKLFAFRRRRTPEKWTAEWVDRTYAGATEKIRHSIRQKLETLPPGSASRTLLERLRDLPPEKLLEEMSARAYPNPERVGCPPYRILMELATRRRGLDDPVFEHIEHCHPCGAELGRMVRAFKPPNPS